MKIRRRPGARLPLVRVVAALLVLAAIGSTPAAAQEAAPTAPILVRPPTPRRERALTVPTVVFMSAAVSDMASTYVTNRWGGLHEQNPTLNWLQPHPLAMVALGAAMDVAGVRAWNHFVGTKHPRLAAAGLYAGAAFRTFLAARNLHRATFGPIPRR